MALVFCHLHLTVSSNTSSICTCKVSHTIFENKGRKFRTLAVRSLSRRGPSSTPLLPSSSGSMSSPLRYTTQILGYRPISLFKATPYTIIWAKYTMSAVSSTEKTVSYLSLRNTKNTHMYDKTSFRSSYPNPLINTLYLDLSSGHLCPEFFWSMLRLHFLTICLDVP